MWQDVFLHSEEVGVRMKARFPLSALKIPFKIMPCMGPMFSFAPALWSKLALTMYTCSCSSSVGIKSWCIEVGTGNTTVIQARGLESYIDFYKIKYLKNNDRSQTCVKFSQSGVPQLDTCIPPVFDCCIWSICP